MVGGANGSSGGAENKFASVTMPTAFAKMRRGFREAEYHLYSVLNISRLHEGFLPKIQNRGVPREVFRLKCEISLGEAPFGHRRRSFQHRLARAAEKTKLGTTKRPLRRK